MIIMNIHNEYMNKYIIDYIITTSNSSTVLVNVHEVIFRLVQVFIIACKEPLKPINVQVIPKNGMFCIILVSLCKQFYRIGLYHHSIITCVYY